MKSIIFSLIIFLLCSCGADSSPEGRITKEIQSIQMHLDTLKMNQRALNDTLSKLRQDLNNLSKEK